jgi:hypothetical protein
MVSATLMADSATAFGLTAAATAVCGFVAHARLSLSGADERRLRRATTVGGMGGIAIAGLLIVLSAVLKVAV